MSPVLSVPSYSPRNWAGQDGGLRELKEKKQSRPRVWGGGGIFGEWAGGGKYGGGRDDGEAGSTPQAKVVLNVSAHGRGGWKRLATHAYRSHLRLPCDGYSQ